MEKYIHGGYLRMMVVLWLTLVVSSHSVSMVTSSYMRKKISYLKKSWIGIRMPGFESSFQQWLHESKKNPPSGDTLPHLSHRMNEGLNQDSEQEMHVGK